MPELVEVLMLALAGRILEYPLAAATSSDHAELTPRAVVRQLRPALDHHRVRDPAWLLDGRPKAHRVRPAALGITVAAPAAHRRRGRRARSPRSAVHLQR